MKNKLIVVIDDNALWAGKFENILKNCGVLEKYDFCKIDFYSEFDESKNHIVEKCISELEKIINKNKTIEAIFIDVVLEKEESPTDSNDLASARIAKIMKDKIKGIPIIGITRFTTSYRLVSEVSLYSYFHALIMKQFIEKELSFGDFNEIIEVCKNKSKLEADLYSKGNESIVLANKEKNNHKISKSMKGVKKVKNVKFGIVTALPEEYEAVKAVFQNGNCESKNNHEYYLTSFKTKFGVEHNIVVTMSEHGNNMAAIRAQTLLSDFKTVRYLLMVGIAGGVPFADNVSDHVRLGDIVVSDKNGIIQYDFIKEKKDKKKIRNFPIAPSSMLLRSAKIIEGFAKVKDYPWLKHLKKYEKKLQWKRPKPKTDKLYDSKDKDKLIKHPKDILREKVDSRVFLGPIASANTLLKNPVKRDFLRGEFGVKAVEMEGSGISDVSWDLEKPYIVVRGVCDYCDSHKNDDWHDYSALIAASYTRSLLENIPYKAKTK